MVQIDAAWIRELFEYTDAGLYHQCNQVSQDTIFDQSHPRSTQNDFVYFFMFSCTHFQGSWRARERHRKSVAGYGELHGEYELSGIVHGSSSERQLQTSKCCCIVQHIKHRKKNSINHHTRARVPSTNTRVTRIPYKATICEYQALPDRAYHCYRDEAHLEQPVP